MRFRAALAVLGLAAAACSDSSGTGTTSTTVEASVATTSPAASSSSTTTTATTAPEPATTATTAPSIPLAEIRVDVELVADGFEQPVFALARPGDDRLYVADQPGIVYALDLGDGGRSVVLDLTEKVAFGGEQGLLGLAFHPGDPTRLIVHYSGLAGETVVAQYRIGESGTAISASERIILTHPQPAVNHNGGMIDFGPDGYLYIALGDGGGSNDQFDNGQNPFTLLGAILRLDLDSEDPYGIPPDNPFADGTEGAPEVWAFGLRNPWRFAFDGNDLWVGDVGQARWEEIDLLDARRPGDNAGWPPMEGSHCFRVDPCTLFESQFVQPVTEFFHDSARCSVTGGVVYRGSSIAGLEGSYLYGDYCSGEVWGLRSDGGVENQLLTDNEDDIFLPPLIALTSFGVGPDGEVYLLQASGLVWRLVGA